MKIDLHVHASERSGCSSSGEEELIELSSGCICCVVRGDLIRELRALLAKNPDLDGIIIETTGLAACALPLMITLPQLIVSRPFFPIAENFIGFVDLFEAFFSLGIAGIYVGMVLTCQTPKCFFYLFFICVLIYA